MKMIIPFLIALISLTTGYSSFANGFSKLQHEINCNRKWQDRSMSSWPLKMAIVPPSETSTVGVVGRGYISILAAKLSMLSGYQTWIVCPPGDEQKVSSLIDNSGNLPENLKLVSGSDTDLVSCGSSNAND